MAVLVVGSIALDDLETPYGKADRIPGGSAIHFSAAASFFNKINLVGVVGKDFDFNKIQFLKEKQADLRGIMVEAGETFRWGARYSQDMNQRETLFTHLNVFENFKPEIPDYYQQSNFVFLANIHPELQLDVLEQIPKPQLSVLDTMNLWISTERKALAEVIKKVDALLINDQEIQEFTAHLNIFKAAREMLRQYNLKILIVKRGEYGSIMFTEKGYFLAPAYPVPNAIDPTGAGDSFAGGFIGYLSTCKETLNESNLRQAVIHGTISASFIVENFGFIRLTEISKADITSRVNKLRQYTQF